MTITENEVFEFRKYLEDCGKKDNTIKTYERNLRFFADYLKDGEITEEVLREYKQYLIHDKGMKLRSVNVYLNTLRFYCNEYKHLGLEVPKYSTSELNEGPTIVDRGDVLTYGEYQRLIETANQHGMERIGIIIQVLAGVGLKIGELQYVTKTNIAAGYIPIVRNNKRYLLKIDDNIKCRITQYIKEKNVESELIFCSVHGNPLDRSNVWRNVKEVCNLAHVDSRKVTLEKLKNTYILR